MKMNMYHLPISVKKRKEIGDAYVKSGYFIQGFLEGQQAFCGFIQHGLIRWKTGHSS